MLRKCSESYRWFESNLRRQMWTVGLEAAIQLRSSKFFRGCEMYQEATVVERPFEYDVPADNGNMRFGVKAHHIMGVSPLLLAGDSWVAI